MQHKARKAALGQVQPVNRYSLNFIKGGGDMDLSGIAGFVQNLGFPVACVVALFYCLRSEQQQHKEEMLRITEALNNNTIALTELKALWPQK